MKNHEKLNFLFQQFNKLTPKQKENVFPFMMGAMESKATHGRLGSLDTICAIDDAIQHAKKQPY